MLYGFLALHIDRRNNVLHFTRIGGGSDRTVHLAPRVVEVGGSIPLGKSFDVGMAWGCYDADRMGKTRNPDNKYQYFCKYFNDVAKITDDGTMTARKVGESVAVATTPDMRRAIFAVEVRSRPASQRSCPSGETALRDF